MHAIGGALIGEIYNSPLAQASKTIIRDAGFVRIDRSDATCDTSTHAGIYNIY